MSETTSTLQTLWPVLAHPELQYLHKLGEESSLAARSDFERLALWGSRGPWATGVDLRGMGLSPFVAYFYRLPLNWTMQFPIQSAVRVDNWSLDGALQDAGQFKSVPPSRLWFAQLNISTDGAIVESLRWSAELVYRIALSKHQLRSPLQASLGLGLLFE